MSTVNQKIVSTYTEATPNPMTMKFVLNQMLFPQNSADFPNPSDAEGVSALATALFSNYEWVKGVFIMNNFITLTKKTEDEWFELIPEVREFIRAYVAAEKPIIDLEKFQEQLATQPVNNSNEIAADDSETVIKIKELLKKYVQPAVEMDGGSIVFRSYNEGVVKLGMQGACSGCPSSSVTLKAGIEGLLKRMMPEIKSVEAESL